MKKFIIIGSIHGACYLDIFPLIMNNEIWLGVKKGFTMTFNTDNGDVDVAAWWFTNLSHNKRNVPLELNKRYSPEKYPVYDNYAAIEVGKVADIPMDEYIDVEIPDDEYTLWKKAYGDDVEIIERSDEDKNT